MPSIEALYDEAYDFLCDGETDQAIDAYKAILEIDPNYVEAVHDLAHAYADNEQLDEAIEMAKKLTELSPDDEMSYTVLSRLYQQKGMGPGGRSRGGQGAYARLETPVAGAERGQLDRPETRLRHARTKR